MKKSSFCLLVAVTAFGALAPLSAQTVPSPYKWSTLATGLNGPTGLDAALHQTGAGPLGHFLYVAETGANQIVRLDLKTGVASPFAVTSPVPTELGCYGGPFAQYMYVATSAGIERVDSTGVVTPFALLGLPITDVDFGKGKFGQRLYASESLGFMTVIWEVDGVGNANVFTMLPGVDAQHIVFGGGGQYGHDLYVSDSNLGRIYRIDPNAVTTLFTTVQPGLQTLTFGPGGSFGKVLYAGNRFTGDIVQVAANGTVLPWGNFPTGVADIHFMPGGEGGAEMCVTDGFTNIFGVKR